MVKRTAVLRFGVGRTERTDVSELREVHNSADQRKIMRGDSISDRPLLVRRAPRDKNEGPRSLAALRDREENSLGDCDATAVAVAGIVEQPDAHPECRGLRDGLCDEV